MADLNKSFDARKIESGSSASLATKQELFPTCTQQRYFKVWHDHGPIARRGHIMVHFSCLCDPAFFYTPKELGIIYLISVVENLRGRKVHMPAVHSLAQVCLG